MNTALPDLAVFLLDNGSDAGVSGAGAHDKTRIHAEAFSAGHTLFRAGDLRDCAYLIDAGEVEVRDESGAALCHLGPGEIFGEMALVDTGARTATAVTLTHADIFIIPRSALRDRVRGLDPILSLLFGLLIERYRITRIHLPESIRQDQAEDMVKKVIKSDALPEELEKLSDIRKQRDIALKELKIEQEICRGLEKSEFEPYFQPILKLPEQTIVGFETLIRWNHPDKGVIPPNEFIPVAERTGVVRRIDRMMMEKTCRAIPDMLEIFGESTNGFFISVNLSGINFETLDVIQHVREALIQTEVEPHHLKLEITESALIGDPERAEQVLKGLKALGVTIALDDFGTGYSSLGYLHTFSIDSLKIDRSFVSKIHDAPKSIDIVRAIVGLARNFKLGVIAEGIETEQDVGIINALGVDMGQGYFFGRPMKMNDAKDYIKKKLG